METFCLYFKGSPVGPSYTGLPEHWFIYSWSPGLFALNSLKVHIFWSCVLSA